MCTRDQIWDIFESNFQKSAIKNGYNKWRKTSSERHKQTAEEVGPGGLRQADSGRRRVADQPSLNLQGPPPPVHFAQQGNFFSKNFQFRFIDSKKRPFDENETVLRFNMVKPISRPRSPTSWKKSWNFHSEIIEFLAVFWFIILLKFS